MIHTTTLSLNLRRLDLVCSSSSIYTYFKIDLDTITIRIVGMLYYM